MELAIDGVWHGICNKWWGNKNADVFCRELGFHTGLALTSYDLFLDYIYVNDMHCDGTESSVHQCAYTSIHLASIPSWGHICSSYQVAYVHCIDIGV